MKKERNLWIVELVIICICLVAEIILIVTDFSWAHLIYIIAIFSATGIYLFMLFVINRIIRETKEVELIGNEIEKATHENLQEFTKWLTERSNNYVYESLLVEFENERGIKLPETKKEIISEMGGGNKRIY